MKNSTESNFFGIESEIDNLRNNFDEVKFYLIKDIDEFWKIIRMTEQTKLLKNKFKGNDRFIVDNIGFMWEKIQKNKNNNKAKYFLIEMLKDFYDKGCIPYCKIMYLVQK